MTQFILKDLQDGVLTLTMNRPERLNAMNHGLVSELLAAVTAAASDPEVRAVVLAGAGKGFCAGGDVSDMSQGVGAELSFEQQVQQLRGAMEISRLLREMPKPTIARLHGAVAGAGMSMALACDLRLAAQSTLLTTAFAKVGLAGDFGGSYYLTQLVGPAKAKELYFTSAKLDAAAVLALGLATRVVPDEQLATETAAFARSLAQGATVAIGYMKRNINAAAEGIPHARALDQEAFGHIRSGGTEDHREAANAFVAKRAPVFKGR